MDENHEHLLDDDEYLASEDQIRLAALFLQALDIAYKHNIDPAGSRGSDTKTRVPLWNRRIDAATELTILALRSAGAEAE